MFLMPAGNVGLPDHDLRVDTRRQALQSLLVTATPMTTPLQPFRGLPFIEAHTHRASNPRSATCSPFGGCPSLRPAGPGRHRSFLHCLQPFRGLPFIEAPGLAASGIPAPTCSPFGGCPSLRRVRLRHAELGHRACSPFGGCPSLRPGVPGPQHAAGPPCSPFGGCPSLRHLTSRVSAPESACSPFGGCPSLRPLRLDADTIEYLDLQPFRGLPFIEAPTRTSSRTSAVPACSPFGGCPSLRHELGHRAGGLGSACSPFGGCPSLSLDPPPRFLMGLDGA